jgi:hypothetical protein
MPKTGKTVIFFVWNNTNNPQYIPLPPIYERLEANPNRARLMASLNLWLDQTASRVFDRFGFVDARKHLPVTP